MPFDFKLPDIGEGLHEATLVEWLVAEGEKVTLDQPFCRVETDKAVVEIPAPRAATVATLHVEAGDTVTVGQVMISFALDAPPSSPDSTPPATKDDAILTSAPLHMTVASGLLDRPLATPHTRALARRLGVDLTAVTPTGPKGRITDADVERAAERGGEPTDEFLVDDLPSVPATSVKRPRRPRRLTALVRPTRPVSRGETSLPPAALRVDTGHDEDSLTPVPEGGALLAPETEERLPVTPLRRVIADAMVLSKRTAAHVTHVDEADVTELLRFHSRARDRVAHESGQKLTLLPYFVKAVVSALKNNPTLNASYDEARQEIVIKRYYHLGLAVDTPQGLMVPVLRHADHKDLLGLAAEIEDLAFRARERSLGVEELRGASFTISSLGPLGGAFATPIIHQPELAIVGLHAIKDRPAVVDGQVLARKMMFVSLSYDHRIIDGAVAARFLAELIDLIQNPDLLMLRL